jgi:chromosome segregation ATPase
VALLEAMVLTLRQRLQEEEQRGAALERELAGSRREAAALAAARQELQEEVAELRRRLDDTEGRLDRASSRSEGLAAQVGEGAGAAGL